MKLSFRWYGEDDKVTLQNIRQIPGMDSIVTAVYDVPAGEGLAAEHLRGRRVAQVCQQRIDGDRRHIPQYHI